VRWTATRSWLPVRKTGRLIIAHEAHKRLGPGAEIGSDSGRRSDRRTGRSIIRVAARNVPLPYSPDLERFVLLKWRISSKPRVGWRRIASEHGFRWF